MIYLFLLIVLPIALLAYGGYLVAGKKNNKGWIVLGTGALILIFSLLFINSVGLEW